MSTSDVKGRILLVEDNATIRDAFSILLTEHGYEVLQAPSGEDALSIAAGNRLDLILMDLGLPDIHGLDVTRQLKADDATKHIPVVAITGRALETDERACLEAGCAVHLAKPINSADLLRLIPQYL